MEGGGGIRCTLAISANNLGQGIPNPVPLCSSFSFGSPSSPPLHLARIDKKSTIRERYSIYLFRQNPVYTSLPLRSPEVVQHEYEHEREISKCREVKTGFSEGDKCKPGLLRLSLAGNLEKPLKSLYGTEWKERGYGFHSCCTASAVGSENRNKFFFMKTAFSKCHLPSPLQFSFYFLRQCEIKLLKKDA
jgi:hypothetical protein